MKQRIFTEKLRLSQRLSVTNDLLQKDIEDYLFLFDRLPVSVIKYHHLSDAQISFNKQFLNTHGHAALCGFHQLIMLELIMRFPQRAQKTIFPDSIRSMFFKEFERILTLIENGNDFVFDWSNDLFAKDMGICSLRLIPVGARLLEVSGFSRKPLLNDWRRLISNLYFLFFIVKASRPLYEMHVHMSNLGDFHPEGWAQSLVRVGQLLKLNPEIKGLHGTSWFYDPALKDISPHLAYLREIPCNHGARVFFVSDDGNNSEAFTKSKKRKTLFLNKKYIPKLFLLIWPRNELIIFSDVHQHLLISPNNSEILISNVPA